MLHFRQRSYLPQLEERATLIAAKASCLPTQAGLAKKCGATGDRMPLSKRQHNKDSVLLGTMLRFALFVRTQPGISTSAFCEGHLNSDVREHEATWVQCLQSPEAL